MTSDERDNTDQPSEPGEPTSPAAPHAVRRYLGRAIVVGIAILAAVLVSFVSIDLGPSVRARAERAASAQLDRPVRIGRIGILLLSGEFVVEDLVIDGLREGDDPFFVCDRIVISSSWMALLGGELLFDQVDIGPWKMVAESFPGGRQSFPRFVAEREVGEPDPAPVATDQDTQDQETARRLVVTVQRLVAHDGEFVYRDHNTPWNVVARNITLSMAQRNGYGGDVTFDDGTLVIRDFEPMSLAMEADYALDGGQVTLTDIALTADGFRSTVGGRVDLLNWPEQTYQILDSDIDLPTMKEIFFAGDPFTVSGETHLSGEWHIYDGGRDLTGTLQSDVWALNDVPLSEMTSGVLWTDSRFEVFDYRSGFAGGTLDLGYIMAPLGDASGSDDDAGDDVGRATLDMSIADTDVSRVFEDMALPGLRPRGIARGEGLLSWPIGHFDDHEGEVSLAVAPPDAVTVMSPARARVERGGRLGSFASSFDPAGAPWQVPVGADVAFTIDAGVVDFDSSRLATAGTVVEFDGRATLGHDADIQFHVLSADWQDSDRLMAAVLTATGRPTREVAVGGRGEMRGALSGPLGAPRIEGQFDGHDIRAWNVDWGRGSGQVVIEDSYLDVVDGVFDQGDSRLYVNGKFSVDFPRTDGGEEIDGHFSLESMPARMMRDAFEIEGYEINGPVTGEMQLFGQYRRMFGTGALTMQGPVAWGEPFDAGSARLQFEGDGVRIDGLELRKSEGALTGAMFIGWNGTYSLNLDGRDIDLSRVAAGQTDQAAVGGLARFAASGAGALDEPRYEVRGTVSNFGVNSEVLGDVTGRVDVRDGLMSLDIEAASPNLAISGSGRVDLGGSSEADLSFRFTNTTLDPLVRAVASSVPDETSAMVSGTLTVRGPLRATDQIAMAATVEQLRLQTFGYAIENVGAVRLTLDRNVVGIGEMRLRGDQTELTVDGRIRVDEEGSLDLHVDGDAGLAILQTLMPDLRGSGAMSLVADIEGTLDRPVVVGHATVVAGRIRHFALPHGLDDIEGRIVFEPDGLRFDELSGRLAGGPVQFGGRVASNGLEISEFNVTADATDVNLRFPESIRSVVDARLTLGGDLRDAVLSGTVNVKDAIWLQLFEPSAGFLNFTADDAVFQAETAQSPIPLRLDVEVIAPSTLRISERTARVVASAALTVSGTLDDPLLFGNAEIDRGEVFFEGNRYRVTQGSLGFSDPTSINPFFDIQAETHIRVPAQTYRVTLGLTGTMERLDVELSSDPPLQEFEILSLLLGDVRDPQAAEIRSLREQEESRQELLQAGAARLLTSPLSSRAGRVVEESFGVDSFEIAPGLSDPAGQQSAQLLPTARVLIGQRISDRAHITFSRAVSGANQDLVVVLEYDQNDRLSWILSQNADRTYALDFRVRHAF